MWLYIPESCHSVQVTEDSILALNSVAPPVRLCVTSSGKPTQRLTSWQGWKSRTWITDLSGMTLKPSMVNLGVAQWIASLLAIPANLSALQETSSELRTPDTYGPTLPESSEKFALSSASSKTLPTISTWDSIQSPETYKKWVTALRRHSLQRRKSVHLTSENDSSSWPTATAGDAKQSGASGYSTESGRHNGTTLTDAAVRNWRTPLASEVKNGCGPSRMNRDSPGLYHEVAMFTRTQKNWPTPKASEADRGAAPSEAKRRSPNLKALAQGYFPPDKTPKIPTGETGLGRRLNPDFVEALMGLPSGMTDCDCAVTEWSLWWRRMRSAYCHMISTYIRKEHHKCLSRIS